MLVSHLVISESTSCLVINLKPCVESETSEKLFEQLSLGVTAMKHRQRRADLRGGEIMTKDLRDLLTGVATF